MHVQLRKMRPVLVNRWGSILVHDDVRSHMTRTSLQKVTDLRPISHILLISHLSTTIYLGIWTRFDTKNHFVPKEVIIIIKSHWKLRVPWHFFAVHLYHPSFLVDPLNSIQCPLSDDASKTLKVGRHCHINAWENATYDFLFTSTAVLQLSCSSSWIVCEMWGRCPYSCCFVGFSF